MLGIRDTWLSDRIFGSKLLFACQASVYGTHESAVHFDDDDIFVNCNWVVTRWQYTFTHKQYIEQ